MVALLHRYPHVIAWVAGHSHVNDVTRLSRARAAATASGASASPPRPTGPSRRACSQVFDNHDGTLSIFGTIVDHASEATAPPPGTDAVGHDARPTSPRSAARSPTTIRQTGARACEPDPCGEGGPDDRNVELLITDPRRGRDREPGKARPGQRRRRGQAPKLRAPVVAGTAKGEPARHLRLRPAPRPRRRRPDQASAREDCGRRPRPRPRLRSPRRQAPVRCGAAATSPSTAADSARAASGAIRRARRAARALWPAARSLLVRAGHPAVVERLVEDLVGSTPCSSATSRSERPDSAASLTMSAARS